MSDETSDKTAATLAQSLGEFVAGYNIDSDPAKDALLARARWQILDMFGSAYLGWASEDRHAFKLIASYAGDIGSGPSTVIGVPGGASAPVAAFLNGTLGHSWDFDDIHLATMIHCESFATAATFAVAEERRVSGKALAEAWVLAVEVALRLASGIEKLDGLGLYEPEGFHSTPIFGSFGAAAGASKLFGLDAVQTANALALVVSFTSGTVEGWGTAGARNKPLQPGWAAHAGVTAARLAAAGYTCSLATIDGPKGFYHSHAWGHTWSASRVLDGIGENWLTQQVAVKLRPCGAICQNAVESAEDLVVAHGIGGAEVLSGRIVLPAYIAAALKNIGASLYRPTNGSDALGSIPVLVARVLLSGYLGVEHLTAEAVRDPELLALADRLELILDDNPVHNALPLDHQPTTLTLTTARGEFSTQHGVAAGHPDRLSAEGILKKFTRNMSLVADAQTTDDLAALCGRLEQIADVSELAALLRHAPQLAGIDNEKEYVK